MNKTYLGIGVLVVMVIAAGWYFVSLNEPKAAPVVMQEPATSPTTTLATTTDLITTTSTPGHTTSMGYQDEVITGLGFDSDEVALYKNDSLDFQFYYPTNLDKAVEVYTQTFNPSLETQEVLHFCTIIDCNSVVLSITKNGASLEQQAQALVANTAINYDVLDYEMSAISVDGSTGLELMIEIDTRNAEPPAYGYVSAEHHYVLFSDTDYTYILTTRGIDPLYQTLFVRSFQFLP
jgi:hypothetical protein